nr:hypothetical protein [uncultured Desulfobulbus sp.]
MNHDAFVESQNPEKHILQNQQLAKLEASFSGLFMRTMMGYCTVSPFCIKENAPAIEEK